MVERILSEDGLGPRWRLREAGAEVTLSLPGELRNALAPCGVIGYPQAASPADAVRLLHAAREFLHAAGCREILGPMEGSTWGPYRLITADPEHLPTFPGEPEHPAWMPAAWEAAGFSPATHYQSRAITGEGLLHQAASSTMRARFSAAGLRLRAPDAAHPAREVESVLAVAMRAFADAPYFRPVPLAFALAGMARREGEDFGWPLLAEDAAGQVVGFLHAYPWRGMEATVILKTLAVLPLPELRGVGAWLTDQLHARAVDEGYGRVIHALMHNGNPSVRLSGRYGGTLFRRYTLYRSLPLS